MGELAPLPAPQEKSDTEKQAALEAFLGTTAEHGEVVVIHDAETAEHWRLAPPSEHADAMAQLSNYAERMSAQTGLGKPADEQFPGFPSTKRIAA